MEPSCPLLILIFLMLCSQGAPFRICAFNTQRFAQGKVDKAHILDTFVKILSRCDIAVLQEVMDAKGKAIPALAAALNRNKRTQVLDSYKYEDDHLERPDVFAREPFIVRFSLPNKALPELVLIPQHTMPSKAEAEIDALYDVFLNVQARWGTEDMIFLGDFNADCGYVAKKRWGNIRLRQKPGIVVHGEQCLDAIVPGSAQPFDFPKEFGLSEAEALEISDHYPVEVELYSACWGLQPTNPVGLLFLAIAMLSGTGYGI
ncbi:hypothetical protein JD844_010295 [Phrynosoma platyrhinos]|uniref:Deoxyribonuclease-1-like 1 n=1 Tax=Phrynosoma platyrhinos TaxID=52577 RepID=A0ABQ7TI20_PHRPL|nr:hypothetical protein JD844_010295 [Phrynosoma platyrhinos]